MLARPGCVRSRRLPGAHVRVCAIEGEPNIHPSVNAWRLIFQAPVSVRGIDESRVSVDVLRSCISALNAAVRYFRPLLSGCPIWISG